MEQKYYWIFSVVIVVAIAFIFIVSNLPESTGGIEIKALKTLQGPSQNVYKTQNQEFFEPTKIGDTLRFQFETLDKPVGDYIFKLKIEDGVEYIDGNFELINEEYILNPTYNSEGRLDTTLYWFELKGVEEGVYKIGVEVRDKEDNSFGEWRFTNLCVA